MTWKFPIWGKNFEISKNINFSEKHTWAHKEASLWRTFGYILMTVEKLTENWWKCVALKFFSICMFRTKSCFCDTNTLCWMHFYQNKWKKMKKIIGPSALRNITSSDHEIPHLRKNFCVLTTYYFSDSSNKTNSRPPCGEHLVTTWWQSII